MCFGSHASKTIAPTPAYEMPSRHTVRHAVARAVRAHGGKSVHRDTIRENALLELNPPYDGSYDALVKRIDEYLNTSKKLGKKSAYKHKGSYLRAR